jgi:hypothetical protein
MSKNNQNKMDWRCGSSGRAPALQEQSLELRPQSHKKKKEFVSKSNILREQQQLKKKH